jgi:hypothetical protein
MSNPFEVIEKRLDAIQNLLVDLAFQSAPTEKLNDLLTAEQLREKLNICKASERVYVQAGLLQPQYLGRRVYYSWNQVTAALENTSDQLLPTKLRGHKKTAN